MPPDILEFLKGFLKALAPYLVPVWEIIKSWWWLALPFLFWRRFLFLWLWRRQELWSATQKMVLLEIRIPKEILKPIRAMEQVFAGIHSLHDVVVWREKWIEGQYQMSVSLEIASIGGEVHFFIRTPASFRAVLEANIYSQYPDVEITEAEDYTRKVPRDIPNKNWDLFGFDMINTKPNPYPIRTYTHFETEKEALEEKRIDPLANLIEGMAGLKPGEQLWVQIIAKPIRDEVPWTEEGKEIIDELTKRDKKDKNKFNFFKEALDMFISGEPPEKKDDEKESYPLEMKLTPGERDLVKSIEEKIHKFGYVCTVRFIYLGEKGVFFKGKARIPFAFFKEISYENLGGLKPWKVTATKVKTVFTWFWDKRREFVRKRNLYERYSRRFPPLFPKSGGTYILNSEELATLFHFPGKPSAPAPAFSRIESKRGEAPPGLPVE